MHQFFRGIVADTVLDVAEAVEIDQGHLIGLTGLLGRDHRRSGEIGQAVLGQQTGLFIALGGVGAEVVHDNARGAQG